MKILLYFNPRFTLAFNLSMSLRYIAYGIENNQHLTEDELPASVAGEFPCKLIELLFITLAVYGE